MPCVRQLAGVPFFDSVQIQPYVGSCSNLVRLLIDVMSISPSRDRNL